MENSENIEMNTSLMCISEMLEREVEKDRYRSFFHGANNCSLRLNWYSGVPSHVSTQGSVPNKPSIKRKVSLKTILSETDDLPPKKASIDNGKNTTHKSSKRRGIVSSESEDADDADYTLSNSAQPESKKPKRPEVRVRVSESKPKSEEVKPIIKVKSSATGEIRPKVSVKVSFSNPLTAVTPELQSEVVERSAESPKVKAVSHEDNLSVSGSDATSVVWSEPTETAPRPRSQGGVETSVREKMLEIVRKLLADPANELFRDPVPRSCEDYYLLVENPICLRDIWRKVDGNRYKSVQGFRRDLILVVTNCIYYNMLMNVDQISNRHQAYTLHRTILDKLRDLLEERCTAEQLQSLAGVYSGIIEKVYGIEVNGIQLIRYFAIDNKQLTDYDRYVKKAILLRSILVLLRELTDL